MSSDVEAWLAHHGGTGQPCAGEGGADLKWLESDQTSPEQKPTLQFHIVPRKWRREVALIGGGRARGGDMATAGGGGLRTLTVYWAGVRLHSGHGGLYVLPHPACPHHAFRTYLLLISTALQPRSCAVRGRSEHVASRGDRDIMHAWWGRNIAICRQTQPARQR